MIVENSIFDAHFTFNYENSPQYKLASARGTSDGLILAETCNNIIINNNYFKNWGHGCISLQAFGSFEQENIEIKNNYMAPADITYGAGRINLMGNSHNVEIHHNIWKNSATGNQIGGYDIHIHDNIMDGVGSSPIKSYANIGFGFTVWGHNVTIENNIIANTDSEAVVIAGVNARDNLVKNNTFYNNGITMGGIAIGIGPNSGGWKKEISLNYVNNIFTGNTIYATENINNHVQHYSSVENGKDLSALLTYSDFLGKYSYTPSSKVDAVLLKTINSETTLESLINNTK